MLKFVKHGNVKFTINDGIAPKKLDEPINIFKVFAPISFNVQARSKLEINLGITCNVPIILVRGSDVKLIAPYNDIRVIIDNVIDETLSIGQNEAIAKLYPLFSL